MAKKETEMGSQAGESDNTDSADPAGVTGELELLTVGERLRLQREEQNKTLEDIASMTRVPLRHLQSIEAGNYENLPGRTYAVGFVKAYARAVDLSETEMAGDLKDEMEYDGMSAYAQTLRQTHHEIDDPSKIPSSRLAWMAALVGLVLVVGGYAVWKLVLDPAPEATYAQSDAADATGQVGRGDVAPVPVPVQDAAPAANGEVVFIAKEDGIWVRFYEDEGERYFEGSMELGERFTVPADAKNPLILTGRPDAFAVTVNGKEVAPLSTDPLTVADVPVSAAALLARNSGPETANEAGSGT